MNSIRTSILFLPFIFVYLLSCFGVIIPGEKKLLFSFFIVPIILFVLFILKFKASISSLFIHYKQTPFRYFLCLYGWIIFVSILAVLKGYYSFIYFLIAVIIGFFIRGFLLLIYPMIVFPKYINLRSLIKFFVISIYIIVFIGIVEFIVSLLNFQPVLDVIHFFSNVANFDRILIESHSSIPRIKGLTAEPSALAGTIVAFLPFIYNLSNCKYRIFKNKFVNLFTKKTLIPLSLFCLILTQSPLGLLFAVIMTIYIYYEKIIKFVKLYYIFVILFVLISGSMAITLGINTYDVSNSYLIRIVNVVIAILNGNLDEFIAVEPSLATRVLCWLNQFQIFFQHPLVGVGFLNRGWILINHMQNTLLPMTFEMSENVANASAQMVINMTTASQLLYQTGIVGFGLYFIYMFKTVKSLNKIINYFSGLKKVFVISFKQYFVFVFVNSIIYGAGFMSRSAFFAMGIANSLIILALNRRKVIYVKNINNSTDL